MNDVSKRCGCASYDHDAAGIALQIVFNALCFTRRQRLSEPNHSGPHERITSRTPWWWPPVVLIIVFSFETTTRTLRLENVSMKLHHLGLPQASALVQIVHVLCDEQKFVGNLRQSGYCFVRGIGPRVANTLAPLTIPLPN